MASGESLFMIIILYQFIAVPLERDMCTTCDDYAETLRHVSSILYPLLTFGIFKNEFLHFHPGPHYSRHPAPVIDLEKQKRNLVSI